MKAFLIENRWRLAFGACLVLLVLLFVLFMGPAFEGDTATYISALNVMQGQPAPAGFMPNRIMTTFMPLELIRAFSPFLGGIWKFWFVMNCLLYLMGCFFFYELLARMFSSERVAFLGSLLLAANYGFFLFGLHYLMDIGGWSFYIVSLYFLFRYSRSKQAPDILLSAAAIGIGGLFKEYAFLSALAIAVYLIIEHRKSLSLLVKRALQTASLAVLPTFILYVYVYHRFGYTYLDWFGANVAHYVYDSRLIEFVKAGGSLANVLALLFIGGVVSFALGFRNVDASLKAYILAVAASFTPIFFWPAITQRILSITIPFAIIVSSFMFKKYELRWYAFLPIIVVYVLMTFFMDSYILTAVNVPF